jgi:hypothetical protein
MIADPDSSSAGAPEADPLVCMLDDVEVPRDRARCLHPTSQCRFRDWCEVAALARRRRAESRDESR